MQNNPTLKDYAGLLTIALCWGTAFIVTKVAVADLPPAAVAFSRTAIAAIVLGTYAIVRRRPFPTGRRDLGFIVLAAVTGTAVPFVLIAWGQQFVDSSVAAIIMALVPLMSLVLAHLFTADEKLNRLKMVAVAIGFSGVVVLFGGVGELDNEKAPIALAAILAGGLGYAISSIAIRAVHHPSPNTVGATIMGVSAGILALPAFLTLPPDGIDVTNETLLALLHLGLFPSALAAILLVRLVRSVGVTFFSFNNFLVPLIGVGTGALIGAESLYAYQLLGLLLILGGISMSRFAKG